MSESAAKTERTPWLKAKPGRAEQRRREHRRRHKSDSERDYREKRAMGLTVDHMMPLYGARPGVARKPVKAKPWWTERTNGPREKARRLRQMTRGVL